jgi:hypothetical protein
VNRVAHLGIKIQTDDRTEDGPAAMMMFPLTARVQKDTISEDRLDF